jgi:hypothetical protein
VVNGLIAIAVLTSPLGWAANERKRAVKMAAQSAEQSGVARGGAVG